MIAGLEEISEGELYIDGKLVNDVAPKDRDIAVSYTHLEQQTVYYCAEPVHCIILILCRPE